MEMIENGVFKGKKNIGEKENYLFGRNDQICDVAVYHNSVSRRHAILQHKEDGSMYIYDMGSTHGTYVNKKIVNSHEFVKVKSGDFVNFGKCPRMFVLEDKAAVEEEEEPEVNLEKKAIEDYLKKEKEKSQYERYMELAKKEKRSNPFAPNPVQNSISWGMVDDEVIYSASKNHSSNQILDPKILRMLPNLTPKQVAKIEKFEKKMRKIGKMQKDWNGLLELEQKVLRNPGAGKKGGESETEKIGFMKEDLGKRMDKMAGDLELMENKLKTMFKFPKEDKESLYKKKAVFGRGTANRDIGSDEEDEFFDRTREEKDDGRREKMLIERAKKSNFSVLRDQLDRLTKRKFKLTRELNDLNLNFRKNNNRADELDSYMTQNEQEIKRERKVAIIKELKNAILETKDLAVMLRYIRSDFSLDDYNSRVEKIENERKAKERSVKGRKKSRAQMLEMIKRKNEELAKHKGILGNQIQKNEEEEEEKDFDTLDAEEDELVMLRKRWRKERGLEGQEPGQSSKKLKTIYGPTMPPEKRDVEPEDSDATPEEPEFLKIDFSDVRVKQMVKRQEASGY